MSIRQDQGPLFPNSSVARALKVVGDPWAFLVLRACFFHLRRFEQIQRSLGIARNVLAARLRHLVANGVLERRKYQDRPTRYEYCVTDKGLDLYPSLLAMTRWGDEWCDDGKGPPLLLQHETCGARLVVDVVCSECGRVVDARHVHYRDGSGAGLSPRPQGRRPRRLAKPDSFEGVRASSVARTLNIVGDQWTIGVIREAFFKVCRFDEMHSKLGVARNILTGRLRLLVEHDILERRRYQTRPIRHEYRLTPKGLTLYPSLILLMRWGDTWLAEGHGPPVVLRHTLCGQDFTPEALCTACGGTFTPADVTYRDGPGARLADEPRATISAPASRHAAGKPE